MVLAVLHSPAHALLDARICELTYHLPRSGRVVVLPVRYVGTDESILIAVGNADAKRWWRAFYPWPAQLDSFFGNRAGLSRFRCGLVRYSLSRFVGSINMDI